MTAPTRLIAPPVCPSDLRHVSAFSPATLQAMRAIRYIIVGVLTVGLLVTSVGWYRVASAGSDQQFDSCSFDGQTLVLSYFYGANERVSPSVDTRGGDVVVALHVEAGTGSTPDIGLTGEARFAIFGEPTTVRYPDGEKLDCPPKSSATQ